MYLRMRLSRNNSDNKKAAEFTEDTKITKITEAQRAEMSADRKTAHHWKRRVAFTLFARLRSVSNSNFSLGELCATNNRFLCMARGFDTGNKPPRSQSPPRQKELDQSSTVVKAATPHAPLSRTSICSTECICGFCGFFAVRLSVCSMTSVAFPFGWRLRGAVSSAANLPLRPTCLQQDSIRSRL